VELLAELSKIEFSTISFPDDPTTSFGGPLDEFDSYEDYRDDLVAKGHLIAVPKVDRLLADAAGLAKDDPLRNEMNYIPNSTKGSRVLDQFALLGLEIGKNLIPGYKFTQGFRKGYEILQEIISGKEDDRVTKLEQGIGEPSKWVKGSTFTSEPIFFPYNLRGWWRTRQAFPNC
jgi:hypothetical protein